MIDVSKLRKDDIVLFNEYVIDQPDDSKVGGVVNKILKDLVVVHWYNPVLCVDVMVLVSKRNMFPFPIGDNLNLGKYKGLTKTGEDIWEYKGKKMKYRHELQNALWDDGVDCWPKGTCDEEKALNIYIDKNIDYYRKKYKKYTRKHKHRMH